MAGRVWQVRDDGQLGSGRADVTVVPAAGRLGEPRAKRSAAGSTRPVWTATRVSTKEERAAMFWTSAGLPPPRAWSARLRHSRNRRLPTRPCARATDAAAGESHAAFGAPERRQPFHIGSACPRASSKCPISTYGGSSFAPPGIPCRSDDYRIVGREGGLDGALGHLGSREVLVQLGGPSVSASQVGAPFCSPQRRAARTDQSG